LLCGRDRDRDMSRGGLMLESSQCGGCGTLGNGGATLPRWMSSQFGVRCNIGIRGAKLSFDALPVGCVWIPCRPAVGWRTHFQSLHVTQSTHVSFVAAKHLSPPHHLSHSGLKENRVAAGPNCWRSNGDLIELSPPRIESLGEQCEDNYENEALPPRSGLLYAILRDFIRNFGRRGSNCLAIKMNFCRQ